MFKKKLGFLLGVMVLLSLAGYLVCLTAGSNKQLNKGEKFLLVTSFYPMYVLAENLTAGVENVTVSNLTENQTGCLHDYQLFPEDMILLSRADAFLVNGAGMELFMEKVIKSNTELPVIETSHGIALLEGVGHHHHEEEDIFESEHESKEEDINYEPEDTNELENDSESGNESVLTEKNHESEGITHESEREVDEDADSHDDHAHNHNGHIWMDVERHREQLSNAAKELQILLPEQAVALAKAAKAYDEKLMELAAEAEDLAKHTKGMFVVIFHEAFAYLAESLDMEVLMAFSLDENNLPSPGEIAEVIEEINYHGAALILIEEMYASYADKILAGTDAQVVYINPLTTGNGAVDSYLTGMRENLNAIRQVLE